MMFFLAAFVDCLAILVMYTIFTIFLFTYVGADTSSSARCSIKNAYITIMVMQISSAASHRLQPLCFIYLHLSEMLREKDAESKAR